MKRTAPQLFLEDPMKPFKLSRLESPCKYCSARYVGCHSTCNLYLDYASKTRRLSETIKKENDSRADYNGYVNRNIKRNGG